MQLRIEQIRMDGGTQPRTRLSESAVDEYAQAMLDGVEFPPVDVYYDGTEYWLADGFHRIQAAVKAELIAIDVTVHQGTLAEAQWHSFGANKAHGLQRSNDDKEASIRAALRHPKAVGLSDRELARHVGVSHATVGKYRVGMEVTGEIKQSPARTGSDGRQINTARIGGGKRSHQPGKPSGGNSPRPEAPAQPHSPPPAQTAVLLSRDLQAAVQSLLSVFDRQYLEALVAELRKHLEKQPHDTNVN